MKAIAGQWLRAIWRNRQKRQDLIGQYQALRAQSPLVLADISQRGLLYSDIDAPSDKQVFINIGRRELALEILQLANISPEKAKELLD